MNPSERLPVVAGVLLAALGAVGLTGCASGGGLASDPVDYGSPDARMAIERFLAGVKKSDYQAMGQQFGTRSGPAEEKFGITEVEQRMIVLAGLLQHDESKIRQADLARTGPNRTRFVATLTGTREGRVALPIVTVVTEEGRWFVEQINVDPLTRDR